MPTGLDTDIHYIIAVPDSIGRPTPLQGFSLSLCINAFLIRRAVALPQNVFDLSAEGRGSVWSRKIGGAAPINWFPQSPSAIRATPLPAQLPFVLVLLGRDQDAEEYRDWASSCEVPPTIVAEKGGDLSYDDLKIESLQRSFLEACDRIPSTIEMQEAEAARKAIKSWSEPRARELGYKVGGHATIIPNLMTLAAFDFKELVDGRFKNLGGGIDPYVAQIVATTQSILSERRSVRPTAVDPAFPRFPDINLYVPMLSLDAAAQMKPPKEAKSAERKAYRTALHMLTRQSGYNFEIRTEHQHASLFGLSVAELTAETPSVSVHPLFRIRQLELALGTECVAALSASDLSATIRLPNEVARTGGAVRQFAEQYRSNNNQPRKRLLAFRQVKNRIAAAVPPDLLDLIKQSGDSLRIVSDAHLEWLDIDGLPLSIRKNTSRIPVTPGNLFVQQTTAHPLLRLKSEDFREILILSAIKRNDPIRNLFEIAFDVFGREWKDVIDVKFVDVSNEDELVAAFNQFDGPFAIFDGHGSHPSGGAAVLHLYDEQCDVWQLRDRVRVPPIVALSACDTHAADRNHATAANGFLTLGARAVLSSALPLDALSAASFAARLVHRVANFTPAAVGLFGRALSWTEVVSGMIRMQLLTDFLRQLLRKNLIDQANYTSIHQRGNLAINRLSGDPFEDVIEMLEASGVGRSLSRRELEVAVANFSAISYLNIGRPETILLDTEERIRGWEKDLEKLLQDDRQGLL